MANPANLMDFSNGQNQLQTNYGSGLDSVLQENRSTQLEDPAAYGKKEAIRSAQASMSAGGSIGQTLTGAGATGLVMGAGPAAGGALAAGIALSYMESKKQADAAHERAVIEEAQNRKSAVQTALNGQLSAARMLSIV